LQLWHDERERAAPVFSTTTTLPMPTSFLSFILALCLAVPCRPAPSLPAAPRLLPEQLAIVINDDEPNSVAIGEYYRKRRGIPAANVVHVRIPGKPRELSEERFCFAEGRDRQPPGPGSRRS
jgi:hypothetical protein